MNVLLLCCFTLIFLEKLDAVGFPLRGTALWNRVGVIHRWIMRGYCMAIIQIVHAETKQLYLIYFHVAEMKK